MRRDEIVELLAELGRRLAARGTEGEMYVVGGAAIEAVYGDRLDAAAQFFVEQLYEP